jgi:hypothetical protein
MVAAAKIPIALAMSNAPLVKECASSFNDPAFQLVEGELVATYSTTSAS